MPFSKLQAGCHVPFTKGWLPSGHSTINAWLVECCRDGCPSSTEELYSSVRVTIGFWVTSLTRALLPWLLSLARQPSLERVLMVPNFFYLRMMEATMFLGTFNAAEMCPRSVPRHNPVSELYGQILQRFGLVFALTCGHRQVCLSKSCPINWIYHRWTPKLKKHLKDDQWKQDAPELNSHSKGSEYLCK